MPVPLSETTNRAIKSQLSAGTPEQPPSLLNGDGPGTIDAHLPTDKANVFLMQYEIDQAQKRESQLVESKARLQNLKTRREELLKRIAANHLIQSIQDGDQTTSVDGLGLPQFMAQELQNGICPACKRKLNNMQAVINHITHQCYFFTICELCKKCVPIRELIEHHLQHCREKRLYRECPKCHKDVFVSDDENNLQRHLQTPGCKPRPRSPICPLCNADNFPDTDDGWMQHLSKCPMNPRLSSSPVPNY